MDQTIVYSKTGKGVLEIKNKAGKLARGLVKVLAMVDGKSAIADIIVKSKLSEPDLERCLTHLEDGGYIKEFSSVSGATSSTSVPISGVSSYVDDLDFTSTLMPGKRVYSNAQSEFRDSESASRQRAESEATRKREEAEEKKKQQAKRQAREEALRLTRIEAERKNKEAAAIKARQQGALQEKRKAAEMAKTTRDLARILEAERKALDKSDGKKAEERARKLKAEVELKREAQVRLNREAEERSKRENEARLKKEAEERRKREDEERRKREDEERRKREDEERREREEEERRKREEEERRKREEEERRKREEEERRKREEEERRKREEEERRKREEEERRKREEEERRKREEEEQRKREEEEQRKREEEERRKREEEEQRKREEEEQRKREEEEQRKREEEEQRKREEEERQRIEEESRRREEEDRRREAEDRRREEEDQRRQEEQRKRGEVESPRGEEEDPNGVEDDRQRREEEDRQRREDEDRQRREDEDRQRREEEDRQRREDENRQRREDEDRQRREDEDRQRREDEDRQRREDEASAASTSDFPVLDDIDIPSLPDASDGTSSGLDLSSSESDSGASFSVDFDKQQEMLKEQAQDEERQIQEAEEERLSMERAAREEDARAEAERRADVEAEMRARVEQEKAERAEREREKTEEYERKIEEEEERKKLDAEKAVQEEQRRVDEERNKREEDLVQRRKKADEEDRKRRELKALKKSGKVRSPVERMVPVVGGVLAVIGLAVGALHVMPMGSYIPTLERIASDNIGEPVTIGSMKVSMLSGLQFKLGNVNVGSTQDVTLNDVTVSPEFGSLFSDRLVVNSIHANGGNIVKEALARLPAWRDASASDQRMHVKSIELRSVTLEMRTFKLPGINAEVDFGRNGQVRSAKVATTDGKVAADMASGNGGLDVSIALSNWTPPFGTPIEITDFSAQGSVTGSVLDLSEWDATVYGGQVKGSAQISWNSGWRATSQFEFVRMSTEKLLAAFTKTAKVSGTASGDAGFSARAASLDGLLDNPTIRSKFLVQKGTLDGVDMVRALQVGKAGSQGGSTKFEQLKGDVTISNGEYRYRNVVLSAGILSAESDFNIAPNQAVRGQVSVALRSSAQQLSASLSVGGSLKGVVLKP